MFGVFCPHIWECGSKRVKRDTDSVVTDCCETEEDQKIKTNRKFKCRASEMPAYRVREPQQHKQDRNNKNKKTKKKIIVLVPFVYSRLVTHDSYQFTSLSPNIKHFIY